MEGIGPVRLPGVKANFSDDFTVSTHQFFQTHSEGTSKKDKPVPNMFQGAGTYIDNDFRGFTPGAAEPSCFCWLYRSHLGPAGARVPRDARCCLLIRNNEPGSCGF